jgi:23S rRNA (pseudouridine1915-N3)-methyltransferase
MLNIRVICVGRLKERFYTDAAGEYIKRLAGYCKLEVVEIPEHRATAIEGNIPDGSMAVALCIEGREIDSPGLAKLLSDCAVQGTSRLCFIIGGSNGLDEEIKNRADIRLSLSRMTFPHNLARVMLLEQLYRAFTIIEGGKYHK